MPNSELNLRWSKKCESIKSIINDAFQQLRLLLHSACTTKRWSSRMKCKWWMRVALLWIHSKVTQKWNKIESKPMHFRNNAHYVELSHGGVHLTSHTFEKNTRIWSEVQWSERKIIVCCCCGYKGKVQSDFHDSTCSLAWLSRCNRKLDLDSAEQPQFGHFLSLCN